MGRNCDTPQASSSAECCIILVLARRLWKGGSVLFNLVYALPQTEKMLPSKFISRNTSISNRSFSSSSNPAYCCFASECLANGSWQTVYILQLYCSPLTEGNPAVPSFWREQLAKLNRGPLKWLFFCLKSWRAEKGKD